MKWVNQAAVSIVEGWFMGITWSLRFAKTDGIDRYLQAIHRLDRGRS